MVIDRKEMREGLVKRTNESNKKQDAQSTVPYESYLDLPSVDINGEQKTFPTYSILKSATEVGKTLEHFFNIVPFSIGNKYPTVDYDFKPGQWTYWLDLWVHTNVGPDKKRVVCPKRNYDKRCPICEHRDELLKEAQTKEERKVIYQEKNPKRRSIYFVRVSEDDKDSEEFKKGVQVLDVAYAWMEQELQKEATLPRSGGIIPYAVDSDEGREIRVCVKKTGEGYYQVDGHKLIERNYEISDAEIEQTFALDECIKLHSYEKLSSIYWGEDEEEEVPEVIEEEIIEEDINKETGEITSHVTDSKPMEDDVPLDNEPVELSCPEHGNFGADWSSFDECDSCELEMDCKIAKRNLNKAKKTEKTEEKVTPRKRPKLD